MTPSGVFAAAPSTHTTGGVANFSNLRVLSAGDLTIVASSSGIASVSANPIIFTNFPFQITMTISPASSSAFQTFSVTVTVKGEDTNLYTGSCSVGLSETNGVQIFGQSSLTTTTGVAVFNIYFNVAGQKNLQVQCSSITSTQLVTIMEQQLEIISISPTVKDI